MKKRKDRIHTRIISETAEVRTGGHRMKKNARVQALVFTVVLIGTLLFSYEYITEHTYHTCTGEACHICVQLDAASQIILSYQLLPVLPFHMVLLCVFTRFSARFTNFLAIKDTLITLKVELLN